MRLKLSDSCRFSPLAITLRFERHKRGRPYHGPHVRQYNAAGKYDPIILPWDFWPPISFNIVKLEIHEPSTGYGLCVYTRNGWSRQDIYFDRRGDL